MLRLGLKYVNARSAGDLEGVASVLAPALPDSLKQELKALTQSERCQKQMRNLFFIHADLNDLEQPKVVLKFPVNHVEILHIRQRSGQIRSCQIQTSIH